MDLVVVAVEVKMAAIMMMKTMGIASMMMKIIIKAEKRTKKMQKS